MYPINTDLSVLGNSTISKDLLVNGNAVFTNNVTIGGIVNFAEATFTKLTINGDLTVSNQSTLNKVTINGNTVFSGSNTVSGINNPATFKTLTLYGVDASLSYQYNDPARPSDLKTSVYPYQISTSDFTANTVESDYAKIGDVTFTAPGLTVDGIAEVDYLHITGNSTSTEATKLSVTGDAVVTGKLSVKDLDISGSVSGLTFEDGTFNTLNVSGASTLNAVTINGNTVFGSNPVSGINTPATFKTLTLSSADAAFTFSYNDNTKPTSLKTSVYPYAVSSSVITANNIDSDYIKTGDVTYVNPGLIVDGIAEIDYLNITGNSTAATGTTQLSVAGKTVLQDLIVTGTATGVTANIDNADVSPKSVTATGNVSAGTLSAPIVNATGTATIKDLVVTGTTTGVTVAANVDGLDIKPKTVVSTGDVTVGGNLTVTGTVPALSVTGSVASASINVSGTATVGIVTAGTINASGNATITGKVTSATLQTSGAATLNSLGVTNTATIKDLIVTGTTTGVTAIADVDGLDIKPATIESTGNVSVGGTLNVTGVLTPAGGLDLSTTDVASKSITTTGNATIGGDLVVEGSFDLSASDLNVNSLTTVGTVTAQDATNASVLPVLTSTTATITNLTAPTSTLSTAGITNANVTTLKVSGLSTLTGKVSAGAAELSGVLTVNGGITSTQAAINITGTNVIIGEDLTVNGTFIPAGGLDLSSSDISTISITTTGNANIGGDLVVDGTFNLSNSDLSAKSMTTTGVITSQDTVNTSTLPKLASTTATIGTVNATTLAVTGASTVQNLTVNGTLTPSGGINLTGADISANSIALAAGATVGTTLGVTGNATVGGTVTVTGNATLNGATTAVKALTATTGAFSSNATVGGTLVVTGNATLNGATTTVKALNGTAITSTGKFVVGTAPADANHIVTVTGDSLFTGNIDCTGIITAQIDLTARDIAPKNITASGTITAAQGITSTTSITAATGVFGASGSTNNNLQVNGNVVTTGDFTVTGKIIGTLDQSTSDISAKSFTTTTGNVTIGGTGALVLGSTGVITGAPTISGNTTMTGTLTVNGATTSVKALTATTSTVTGASTLAATSATSLSVSGNSTLTGTLAVTGTTTVQNLTVNGTLSADLSNLTTTSFKTSTYYVNPHAQETVSTATWTPDGTSNVYAVTLASNTAIQSIANVNGAGSWFFYITQDSTGGRAVTWGTNYSIIGGEVNTSPNAVSICQVVYCGYGTQYDVFIAQRP